MSRSVLRRTDPDGVWYAGLEPRDAVGLAEHLIGGAPLRAKVAGRPGAPDPDGAGPLPAPPAPE